MTSHIRVRKKYYELLHVDTCVAQRNTVNYIFRPQKMNYLLIYYWGKLELTAIPEKLIQTKFKQIV